MNQLTGVIPAVPTPLLENENIDTAGVHKVVDYVIEQGASGVFVLGSMGEGPALVDEQKRSLVETAAKHIGGRVPLLAGISDVSTRKALEAGKTYQQAGADYLVTTAPFYYKFPHPDSILGYVAALAEELQKPVVFYQIPSACGNEVTFDTLDRIFNCENTRTEKPAPAPCCRVTNLPWTPPCSWAQTAWSPAAAPFL
jgi:4-hydroxy-tetrahydrodipicolinate synthase